MSSQRVDTAEDATHAVDVATLRRHVCHVLGVDVLVEGERLVPSGDGTGSDTTRVDWRVVALVLGGDDGGTGTFSHNDSTIETDDATTSGSDAVYAGEPAPCEAETSDTTAAARGRVGPARVTIDRRQKSAVGDVRVDVAGTSVHSRANFSSVRANACVFQGKWSYEATLGSSGIMQLGWCTGRCPFTRENGVGDAPDSFAFDGHRVRRWNVSSSPYGQAWVAGDVITCTIDLTPGPNGGTVSYHRNGVPLGVAFDNVRRWVDGGGSAGAANSALAYFPAVSLSGGERCSLNFGSAPARYPVEGYAPLQDPPCKDKVLQVATKGLAVFEALASSASWPEQNGHKNQSNVQPPKRLLRFEEETLFAAAAMRLVGALLASPDTRRYLIAGCLIPTMMRAAANGGALPEEAAAGSSRAGAAAAGSPFTTSSSGHPPGRVDAYERGVALLCVALEQGELDVVIPELMTALAELARSAPLTVLDRNAERARFSSSGENGEIETHNGRAPTELPLLASHAPLACAVAIARHPLARRAWTSHRGWGKSVEGLLTRRIPNGHDLAVMLPSNATFWPGAGTTEPGVHGGLQRSYPGSPESETLCAASGRALGEAMFRTQTLHAVLFRALVEPDLESNTNTKTNGFPTPEGLLAEPGQTDDELPVDQLTRAMNDARRASAATATATAASARAGDPNASLRDQSFDADLDPDDAADFAASPAGSPAPLRRNFTQDDPDDDDDGWNDAKCRASPLLTLLTWLTRKNAPGADTDSRGVGSSRAGASDPTVLASAYFTLTQMLHPVLENLNGTPLGTPSPVNMFHKSCAHLNDLPLFGGGAAHVAKNYPADFVVKRLRINQADVTGEGVSGAAFGTRRIHKTLAAVGVAVDDTFFPSPVHDAISLKLPVTRLWDTTQLLYHLGVGYHFKAAAYQLQTQIQAAQHLEEASSRLAVAERCAREAAEWHAKKRGEGGAIVDGAVSSTAKSFRDAGEGTEESSTEDMSVPSTSPSHENVKAPPAWVKKNAPAPPAVAPGDDLRLKLRLARASVRDEVVEAARLCWWHRAVLHRPDQQISMFTGASYGAALLLAAMARRGAGDASDTRDPERGVISDSSEDEGEGEISDTLLGDVVGGVANDGTTGVTNDNTAEARVTGTVDAVTNGTDETDEGVDGNESDKSNDSDAESERNRGSLLPHVPGYHLETLIDSFHALRRGDPPFAPSHSTVSKNGLHTVVRLLVRHFHDEKVVNPDIRDAMLQSISVLLQYKEYVLFFEQNDEALAAMVPNLLKAFDSRFWIPVSNILLRLCRGCGFGQQVAPGSGADDVSVENGGNGTGEVLGTGASPPGELPLDGSNASSAVSPSDAANFPDARLARAITRPHPEGASPLFQKLLVDTCRGDPELCAQFLDRLFNTLNWTITEFGVTLKETLEVATRSPTSDLTQHKRKCSVMFELSVTLQRVLEFLTKETPEVFLKPGSLDLHRLTESVVFVLSHVTIGPDAVVFDKALTQKLAPKDKVSKAVILAPIAGILLNLARAESDATEALSRLADDDDDGDDDDDQESRFHTETETLPEIVESIAKTLAKSNVDIAQLEFLRDFNWETHFWFPVEGKAGPETFGREGVLGRDNCTSRPAALTDFFKRVRTTRAELERIADAEDARSIPDEFIDPIMQTVMVDPVTLPGSGTALGLSQIRQHGVYRPVRQVVDRNTIRRHLLSDKTDPFSRSVLDETMLIGNAHLRQRIEKWRAEAPPSAPSLADVD